MRQCGSLTPPRQASRTHVLGIQKENTIPKITATNYGASPQANNPGPGGHQLSIAESAAAPQSKDSGSTLGGQSTKLMRFSFCSLMKPVAMEFLINARSGSKNPSTLTRTTAGLHWSYGGRRDFRRAGHRQSGSGDFQKVMKITTFYVDPELGPGGRLHDLYDFFVKRRWSR